MHRETERRPAITRHGPGRRHRGAIILLALALSLLASDGAAAKTRISVTAAPVTIAARDPLLRPGDTVTGLYKDAVHGRTVGQFRVGCAVVDVAGDLQCTGTLGLRGGVLALDWDDGLNTLSARGAVLGGTRRYADVRGTFTLRRNGKTHRLAISLSLG